MAEEYIWRWYSIRTRKIIDSVLLGIVVFFSKREIKGKKSTRVHRWGLGFPSASSRSIHSNWCWWRINCWPWWWFSDRLRLRCPPWPRLLRVVIDVVVGGVVVVVVVVDSSRICFPLRWRSEKQEKTFYWSHRNSKWYNTPLPFSITTAGGVTVSEAKTALGSEQLNCLKALTALRIA